jgi:nucleoside-diphosphate-sugar epimerase
VIHLAALQVPCCRANPVLAARVNVEGTVRVLEAVRRRTARTGRLVFATSIAAHDALDVDPGPARVPSTLYGACKRADEVYSRYHGVASVACVRTRSTGSRATKG